MSTSSPDGQAATSGGAVSAVADDVTFRYGQRDSSPDDTVDPSVRPVLARVTLEVPAGGCTLLTGRSGSGKSTLLKLFNGLVPHHEAGELQGTVRVGDLDVPTAPLHVTGEHVATVFQNPRTQFYTTDVTSELAFASENFGRDPDVIRRRIHEVAGDVGITHLLGRSLFALSGGERQLVACAGSRVQLPGLYLFDEPTSNLSPPSIERFREFLAGLRRLGATIVVAEHRLYYLRDLVDTAVIVQDGEQLTRLSGSDFFGLDDDAHAGFGLRSLTTPDSGALAVTEANAGPTVSVGASSAVTTDERPRADGDTRDGLPAPATRGLSLRGVRAGYRGRTVLDIDSLDFPPGQVTALTGPNGAGKSTLAHVICGLRTASGAVYLDGELTRPRRRLRDSYLVMQDVHRQLFSDTVRGELTLGPRDSITGDPDAILERFGLDDFADRHPLSLSGGQKQRLVVAAAQAMAKRVYVFDEPSSGLDRGHLDTVAGILRSMADDGAVVVLITHDVELLAACADREVRLRPLSPSPQPQGAG